MDVRRTERGWAGHYCLAERCCFKRNTLLQYKKYTIVVSTVGNLLDRISKETVEIGCDRYYETMVFHSMKDDKKYHDADVSKEISFDAKGAIGEMCMDNEANDMHEAVVSEITQRMIERGI